MEKISWSRARFALKPHPFWAHARGTRRGLRSNHTHCVRKLKMAGGYFEVEAMVRGYHQYKEIWNASIGEGLECQRETGNPHDVFAVRVRQVAFFSLKGVPKIFLIPCFLVLQDWLQCTNYQNSILFHHSLMYGFNRFNFFLTNYFLLNGKSYVYEFFF